MNKKILLTTMIIFLLLYPDSVSANSGPVYWPGYPSSQVISVTRNSPIKVLGEDLVFDFTDDVHNDYSLSGKVTAVYEMLNPTGEPQVVQMAFPIVESISRLSREDILITVDNNSVPFEVYIGDAVEGHGIGKQNDTENPGFDFAQIINSLTDKSYQAESFAENEKAILHIIEVKPTADERINFALDFNFDSDKTRVLTKGFNRYERDNDQTRIASWCYEPETLEILVLGEKIDFTINAYRDGELKEKTTAFTSEIFTREVELKEYLLEYIRENSRVRNAGHEELINETQLYNLYAKALDKEFIQNQGYSWVQELPALEHNKHILTLVYTVEFAPQDCKKVSVSYRTSATMDKRNTVSPLYSFDYILNPAENWKEFHNLKIKIITPEEAPYILKSSIGLTKEEDNVYKAALAVLPENDLSFTLYKDEKITLWDRAAVRLQRSMVYLLFLLFAPFMKYVAIILLIGITVAAVKKARHS